MEIISFLAPRVCFLHIKGPSVQHSGSSAFVGYHYVCRAFLGKWVFKITYLHQNKDHQFFAKTGINVKAP